MGKLAPCAVCNIVGTAGPLLPGTQSRTSLTSALVTSIDIARNSKWLQQSLSHAANRFSRVGLPVKNCLPSSVPEMLKLMRPYIPASQRMPMCISGCVFLKDGLEGLEIFELCGQATKTNEGHFWRFFYHTPVRASIAAFLQDPIHSARLLG